MLKNVFKNSRIQKLSIICVSLIVLSCSCSLHATTNPNIQEEENTSNNKPTSIHQTTLPLNNSQVKDQIEIQIVNNQISNNQTNTIELNADPPNDVALNNQTKLVNPTLDEQIQWVEDAVNRHFETVDESLFAQYWRIQWLDGYRERMKWVSGAFQLTATLAGLASTYVSLNSTGSTGDNRIAGSLTLTATALITMDNFLVQRVKKCLETERDRFSTKEDLIKEQFDPIMDSLKADHPRHRFDKYYVKACVEDAFLEHH